MKFRIYWLLASGMLAMSLQAAEKAAFAEAGAGRPNVVFILIDDLGHYGVTAYGADRITSNQGVFTNVPFSTPRMDSLARDGMRCEYAYAYPLCEPTRVSLMTGMNNSRNFIQAKALYESQITFGDLFRQEGYATCITGKWKQSRGTREFPGKEYVYKFGWDEFCCFDVVGEGKRMIEPYIVDNGKVMKLQGIDPETGRRYYGPDVFNRYALDFIERHQDEPFFLYYPMVLVHDEHTPTPDTRPKALFDEFDLDRKAEYGPMTGDERRYFPDMLRYTDKMIGKVLDKLNALGLSENTLVVVMGDNGTKECFSHVLPDGAIYDGAKGSTTEAGLRVPLLLRWPGKIPSGQVYSAMVNVTDIYPTLCDAVGVPVPNRDRIDGRSFWEQAAGRENKEHRRDIYTWYNANKPITDQGGLLEYAHNKEFKRYAPHKGFPQGRFFDLRSDPLEKAGTPVIKYKWNDWHHAGLDVTNLMPEQRAAYDELGKVLEANRFVPVQGLKIIRSEAPVRVGDSRALACRIVPAGATRRSVIWESSDPTVATIDKFGTLTAHKPGEVTVRVYSWDDAYPVASNAPRTFSRDGLSDSITIAVSR
jgi:arylsulfatase A-like enzyme